MCSKYMCVCVVCVCVCVPNVCAIVCCVSLPPYVLHQLECVCVCVCFCMCVCVFSCVCVCGNSACLGSVLHTHSTLIRLLYHDQYLTMPPLLWQLFLHKGLTFAHTHFSMVRLRFLGCFTTRVGCMVTSFVCLFKNSFKTGGREMSCVSLRVVVQAPNTANMV